MQNDVNEMYALLQSVLIQEGGRWSKTRRHAHHIVYDVSGRNKIHYRQDQKVPILRLLF